MEWATAEPKKFQKTEDKKPGSEGADHPNAQRFGGGMPPGMPGGMPPGHP